MQNNIGTIIKLKRIENKISQENLCRGICTPSYLSRIENNRLIPNTEIYKLLCERLGLEYTKIIKSNYNTDKKIENLYKDLLRKKDSKDKIEELKQLSYSFSEEISIKFNIVYCRYLLINNQIEQAREYLANLSMIVQKGSNRNFFIYSNVSMLYFLKGNKFSNAIEVGIRLMKICGYDSLGNNFELGIFYYNLALAYKNVYSYQKSSYFAYKALNIFNESYDLEQAADCLILLGICYNNLRIWDKAYKSFESAKKIIKKYLCGEYSNKYLGMIENNLGNCFEYQEDYNKAINYYLKSLKFLEDENKIVTIINLIRCFYHINDTHSSRLWLNSALTLDIEQINFKYQIQIEVFSILLKEELNIDNIISVQNTSINYFLSNNLWSLAINYCKIFANLYESLNYNKKASQMYKTALYASEKLVK